ncbi:GNAT family N-acetyltransferase [Leifsonia sp. NPDC058248]|uniref:GNAT family N-acetyltransferase n=1 Tax=Leifsonia sp. NPDC058248 TaxID=3346402 RepID=UPI0036D7CDD6
MRAGSAPESRGDDVLVGDPVVIGPGRPGDVDQCVALWISAIESRDEHPAPTGAAERCRAKFSHPATSFVVARSGDGIVGFGLVTVPGTGASGDPADAAYLALLAVRPGAQGRHAGSRLLDVLTQETRSGGHPVLVLHVLASNRAAVALYEARGWRAHGELFPHPLSGEPHQTYVLDATVR